MLSLNPPIDTSPWAYLRDSLSIVTSGAKNEFMRHDEHYDAAQKFNECLKKLNDRIDDDLNIDIFTSEVRGIKYVSIETCLYHYAENKNNNYREFLRKLSETNEGILKGKIVGDMGLFEDVVRNLNGRSAFDFYNSF